MKFAAATIFTLLLLTQVFSKWLIVIDYAINKNYVSKNLCVNKSKPQLHCNGKCHLAKKIAAEEEQSDQQSSGAAFAKASFSEVLINNELFIQASAFVTLQPIHHSIYLINIPGSLPSSIFRPPLV